MTKDWEVNESHSTDGFTTSTFRQVTIENSGPSDVRIRIAGNDLGILTPGAFPFDVPEPKNGDDVFVEVVRLPRTPGSKGKFIA